MEKRKFTEWLKSRTPTKMEMKIKYFEYFVSLLVKQSKNLHEFRQNDYSEIKTMKLLFFLVNVSIEKNKENSLLKIFDNWYATPLGHVEMDIYRYIKENEGKFSYFKITRFSIELGYF
jgi:hypothetical protein